MAEALLILPEGPTVTESIETPYGRAPVAKAEGMTALIRAEGVDARALIYAAKEMGPTRLLAAEVVQPVSGLLEPGDLVIPADVIDQTRLRPFTFFVGKGYGFIKLNPPFCPDLMASLLASARAYSPRSFKGAVYVGAEGPRDATPAELRMYRQWGGDLVGNSLLPEAYLARELELCYAAITVVDGGADQLPLSVLAAAAANRPLLTCTCGETMRFMKEQGVVGEDWRQW